MATVEKLGGTWVIVRAEQDPDSSAVREFWTGDSWTGQFGIAQQFATKEEGEAYLAQNEVK